MSILPSPVPHPLDYSPWELPGWIYEALEWVIGVEWPDGNEKSVWDLADQWFSIAAVLAAPREDIIAAAGEVRAGYGNTGAVGVAFENAWRRVAEGDDAPLSALLTISNEMGKLIQECGCDIEAAKLEVWIELGILVVELLALAVAVALSAGAASPAAAATMAATRAVIQQIFKRLIGQLAKKTLRKGLKEAGEKAARQLTEGGLKGLAKRAGLEGVREAGEEVSIDLGIQGYQNSTGRRDGIDTESVGRSALGGFAGGAGTSLAGLGPHASGRRGQVAENFGRGMVGEILADNLASLATGGGLTSFEDGARAAASGVTGSAVSQSDAAVHVKLAGRLDALGGLPTGSANLTGPLTAGSAAFFDQPSSGPVSAAPVDEGPGTPSRAGGTPQTPPPGPAGGGEPIVDAEESRSGPPPPHDGANQPAAALRVDLQGEVTARASLGSVDLDRSGPSGEHDRPGPLTASSAVNVGPIQSEPAAVAPSGTVVGNGSGPTADPPTGVGLSSAAPMNIASPSVGVGPSPGLPQTADLSAPSGGGQPDTRAVPAVPQPAISPSAPSPRFPLLEALGPGAQVPNVPVVAPDTVNPERGGPPAPRTPEWYEIRRTGGREGIDRRRYRGYLKAQRERFEHNRRADGAARLRIVAEQHLERAGQATIFGREMHSTGQKMLADRCFETSSREMRAAYALQDLAENVLAGSAAPDRVDVWDATEFERINDDAGDLVEGPVLTGNRSALTGDDDPPPIERSRRYGERGGLRRPLALHQTDLERHLPRDADGNAVRTPDPREGSWFRLANDGGPRADPTRAINCLDCTLSLYETWVHGRPRVSAPRTFDGYSEGDVTRPVDGEAGGPQRVEEVTGGRFQQLCPWVRDLSPVAAQQAVNRGFADLDAQLRAEGHGSFAFLITDWEEGSSHAWVAVNQHGTVLYLDPQNGHVRADLPLYGHYGTPYDGNVTGIAALVVGGDGRPAPFAEQPSGPSSDRTAQAHDGYDETYVNRIDLLGGSDPVPTTQTAVPVGLPAGVDLEGLLAAGAQPVELAQHLDPPTLLRLAPGLDAVGARDVSEFFADPRIRRVLAETSENPPRDEPKLAEHLVRQLIGRVDLVRMIQATPVLADSLTARPMTLYHLASHQQAIDVLGSVLDDIAVRGPEAVVADEAPAPAPTPLTNAHRQISASVEVSHEEPIQPGFDIRRRNDESYRDAYLDQLYEAAAVAQVELNSVVTQLAGSGGEPCGVAGWRTKPKDRQRVGDKVVKHDGDASQLNDLAAAKVEFSSLDQVYAALDCLRGMSAVGVVSFSDRFVSPQQSGYRDIQLMLRTHCMRFDGISIPSPSRTAVRSGLIRGRSGMACWTESASYSGGR